MKIKEIPNSIIYCTNLIKFYYSANEIENISPIVTRFLNRLKYINELQVYNDNQNVQRERRYQESIFNSIVNIINQNYIILMISLIILFMILFLMIIQKDYY